MTMGWMIAALGVVAAISLAVVIYAMSLWAFVVRDMDALPEDQRSALGWPPIAGQATINKRMQTRVVFYGAPAGAAPALDRAAKRYSMTYLSLYAFWFVLLVLVLGWGALALPVFMAVAMAVVRPWPQALQACA